MHVECSRFSFIHKGFWIFSPGKAWCSDRMFGVHLFVFFFCVYETNIHIFEKKNVSTFPPIKPWNCQLVFTTRFMYNLSGNQQLLLMWGYVFLHPADDIFITLIYKSILWTTQVEGHTQVQWPPSYLPWKNDKLWIFFNKYFFFNLY